MRVLLLVLCFAVPASAQITGTGGISYGATKPATCSPGDVFSSSATGVLSVCSAVNTWTDVGAGGGASWGTITGTLANQTDLQTALDGKQAAGTYATGTGTASGTNTGDQTSVTGNAGTATTLQTARTINGVSFNGSANITVTAAGSTLSDTVPVGKGGTGLTALGTGLQVLRTNAGANAMEWATPGAGSGDGWTLSVQALTSSPTDGATIYFGQLPKAPVTSAGISRVYIRKAGTIRHANIFSYSGTAGTNEAWTCHVRLNNATDTAIATVSAATNERTWANTGLSIAVVAGDYVEIKCVAPTFATNPLTTIFAGYVYLE